MHASWGEVMHASWGGMCASRGACMLPGDVHASGRGMCASQGGGMHASWGVHAWPGVCMAGGMHGGGLAWAGVCMPHMPPSLIPRDMVGQ